MDYSKFYLKNYTPEPDEREKEENSNIIIPRIESRSQPEIIYINPDGEEFAPSALSETYEKSDAGDNSPEGFDISCNQNKQACELREKDNLPFVVRRQEKARQPFISRFCQVVLIFAIVIMSLIVSADFVTDGKAIAAISNLISTDNPTYYAVLTNPKDDLQSSQVDSYAMRLKGGAGFTVKNNEKYYNVYAIYKNKSDAEKYVSDNGGEILSLSTTFYDEIESELKNYTDYPFKTVDNLNEVAQNLTDKKINVSQALEQISEIKDDFALTYDNMNKISNGNSDDKSVTLLANASVALSSLEYLCDTSVSRPNLVCDVRYTVCRILFTYCYSA